MDINPDKRQELADQEKADEERKKIIFDCMSEKRRKHILKKGYEAWNPFIEPKDPIDIRKDKTQRTSKVLIREFLQSRTFDEYSNAYGQGVVEICLGVMNNDEKCKGMYDFACWHSELLERVTSE